jgi:hypothetical protein
MDDPGYIMLLILAVVILAIFYAIGKSMGEKRGQPGAGATLGAFLGPVGLVGASLLKDHRRKCPSCCGYVPIEATKCMHCGEELSIPSSSPRENGPRCQGCGFQFITGTNTCTICHRDLIEHIPCPHCRQSLQVSALRIGPNYCCHCRGKFILDPAQA